MDGMRALAGGVGNMYAYVEHGMHEIILVQLLRGPELTSQNKSTNNNIGYLVAAQ